MGKKEQVELSDLKSSPENLAVLIVGSTGTGKSSTIQKCTGAKNIKIGDGHKSVTKGCDVYL